MSQERRPLDLSRLLVEHLNEQATNGLALGLRIGNPGQLAQKHIPRVHMHQRNVVVIAEHGHDLLSLIVPQQTSIDEHAGQLLTDSFVDQHSCHRAIHPAGKPANHLALTHLGPNLGHHLLAERGHGPVAC